MQIIKSILAVLASVVIPLAAAAQDPLGIEGVYNPPPFNGITLPITVRVIGTGGGNYDVALNTDFTVPVLGCKGFVGDVLTRLTSTGGNSFDAVSSFYELNIFGPPGPRGDFCVLDDSSPKPIILVPRSDGVLLDFIGQAEVDQLFTLVGGGGVTVDSVSPSVTAKIGRGKAGSKIKLKYQVNEASGQTSDIIEIYRGTRLIKIIAVALGTKAVGTDNIVEWKSPKKGAGKNFSFIVRSTDPSGNVGSTIATAIRLRAP